MDGRYHLLEAFIHVVTLPRYLSLPPDKRGIRIRQLSAFSFVISGSTYTALPLHAAGAEARRILMRTPSVFVSVCQQGCAHIILFGKRCLHLDLGCVKVRALPCVLKRAEGNKNRGCPFCSGTCLCMTTLSTGEVLTHARTHTCQRLNLSWHTPPQLRDPGAAACG